MKDFRIRRSIYCIIFFGFDINSDVRIVPSIGGAWGGLINYFKDKDPQLFKISPKHSKPTITALEACFFSQV
jgi:hypothetical protein